MHVRDIIKEVVQRGVAPPAKAAGFRKSNLTFRRRKGTTVQIVDYQSSHGNTWKEGRFYINVGVAFDALFGNTEPDANRLKVHDCQYSRRGEKFLSDSLSHVDVDVNTDIAFVSNSMRERFGSIVSVLDRIDSPRAFLDLDNLHVGSELELRARLHYALGDDSAALADLSATAEYFSDRQGMTVSDLIVRHSLSRLKTSAQID